MPHAFHPSQPGAEAPAQAPAVAALTKFASGAIAAGEQGIVTNRQDVCHAHPSDRTTSIGSSKYNAKIIARMACHHVDGNAANKRSVDWKNQHMDNSNKVGQMNETQQNVSQNPGGDLILELQKAPNIPPAGCNPGRFTKTEIYIRKVSDTKSYRMLKLSVTLDATADDGNPFVLSREYNLTGHGVTAFQDEIKSWRGSPLTREELAQFNATQLVLNKPVTVTVAHREIGNKTVAYIKSFQPAAAPVVAS